MRALSCAKLSNALRTSVAHAFEKGSTVSLRGMDLLLRRRKPGGICRHDGWGRRTVL